LVVVTGARQTGKTTLMKGTYSGLRYVNLDSPEDRDVLRNTATASWARTVGPAVLDEVHKEPDVIEKVKHAFDAGAISFSALTGSSRLLLLRPVRESLAGRAFLYNLWPLTASEVAGATVTPLLHDLLSHPAELADILGAVLKRQLGDEEGAAIEAVNHLATWGGMPELLRLEDDERKEWLRSFQGTYLERDLSDMARLTDLAPFRTLQRVAMLRSGGLVSWADFARDAQVSPATARRYIEYLDLSFQVILLQPYHTNLTSRVVKAPKLYWSDIGILRRGSQQWGEMTGQMFETLVVSEIYKWVDTWALDARMYFYRTRSGLEVDILIETSDGCLGVEVKNRSEAHPTDIRSLSAVAEALGDRWLGGLVVHKGHGIELLDSRRHIFSVPLHRLVV